MSKVTFTICLPEWLAQWFVARSGGIMPVKLKKGSLLSVIVQKFVRSKKEAVPQPEGNVEIEIPENKAKPSTSWNYVPESIKDMIISHIRSEFDLCLFNDIIKDLFPKELKKDLIWNWMDENGIELTEVNYWAVEKRYRRLRNRLLTKKRVEKLREKHRNNHA